MVKQTKTIAKSVVKQKTVEQAVVNIGLVGHVDHGKTSLTQALSGKWTDTHSEELKRGISIKLGYAEATFYKCEAKGKSHFTNKPECEHGKTVKARKISFVDSPGHETLMTTMLTGAALMQGAVLVIAANETCPQPQTEEHLMALKLSGIEKIVVAQNKVDLVEKKQAEKNHKEIVELLKRYGFEKVPIIPIAANLGANIELLIEAIETTIPTPNFDKNKTAKMFCSRSFDINKPGTKIESLIGGVLGGSVIQGKLKIGDKIDIAPGIEGKTISTTIVSLGTEDGQLKEAIPGGLIAVGTLLDSFVTQSDRMRGQVIGLEGTLPSTVNQIVLEINYIERLVGEKGKNSIKANEPLVLTIGTSTVVGTAQIKGKNKVEVELNNATIVEKGQQIAISKKIGNRWRLIAFGISQ